MTGQFKGGIRATRPVVALLLAVTLVEPLGAGGSVPPDAKILQLVDAQNIAALEQAQPEVRGFALQALQIQTDKAFNFLPNADPGSRKSALMRWRQWLAEYKAQY